MRNSVDLFSFVDKRPREFTNQILEAEIAGAKDKAKDFSTESKEKAMDLLKKGAGESGDWNAKKEFARARTQRININVLDDIKALQFFEYITLQDNEVPVVITEVDWPVDAWIVSGYGHTPQRLFINRDSVDWFKIKWYKTDRYFYPVRSAQSGDLNLQSRLMRRAEHDLACIIDGDMWTLLVAGIGAFTAGTTYQLDPRIIAALYPTTNYIQSTAQGSLTKVVFMDLFDHVNRLAGGRRVVNIKVRTDAPRDIWAWVSVVSGWNSNAAQGTPTSPQQTVSPQTQRDIEQSGTLTQLFGYNFNIETVNDIPQTAVDTQVGNAGAAGRYLFASMNEPAGKYYEKPGQATEVLYTEKECDIMGKENSEGFYIKKALTMIMPDPMRLNYVCQRYA